MTAAFINPAELATPSGFTHAVRADGTHVYLAGQTALDAHGVITGIGIVQQFERALSNLLTALHAAGGGPEHLVTVTVYVLDMEDYKAHAKQVGQVWRRLAGPTYPAMAGIEVARLWDIEALVELQGVACLPRDGQNVSDG
ncbi:RidA family protein [Mycobacterium vicinigordonae]|uniref:RidA family protein n=1 Tax=Mycobacterium vicinigordonae TaxID=1719132 RepID=A0A7D6E5K3_9MYCO|nr:RidA family protein [Mycobacterium vicinigordonae]QLL07882.1 RidA family protein [Mycobacterium vicinigordonae]